jgi:antitoxin component of MazEF toxin-antitoxin module
MVTAKLRRVGNSFVVTVPREEIERKQLQEGQLVSIEVNPVEVRPALSPDLRETFETELAQSREALDFLARG